MDDADKLCHSNLTVVDTHMISDWCKARKWNPRRQKLMATHRMPYASKNWLKNKTNPVGWMCAQARPTVAFPALLRKYQSEMETRPKNTLPDYVLVLDDDTYYNMEMVGQYLKQYDAETPRAIAGCMVRSPIWLIHYTIPFGGFGLIMSRGALKNFMKPVNCSSTVKDEFSESACRRLKDNQIDEEAYFRDGMSVSELMETYTSSQPYRLHHNWTIGYCLHSDWMWGFFINYYNISKHVDDPFYKNVVQSRMDGYNGSEIYAGENNRKEIEQRKICNNDSPRKCNATTPICHYQTPASMERLTEEAKAVYPGRFTS
uniref:N-acetylgalactosaminide beta-1,3-galactosyltransferase n=1 Tax=Cyclophora tenuis TaxID=216820 RepID=A0A6U1S7A2_CYCTE